MESKFVVAIIAVSFLARTATGWGEDATEIHVEGAVMCQDCSKGWNEWAEGGNPIKGARVSVTCMDKRKRVVFYGGDDTDEAGHFSIIINKILDGKLCSVRLVSSPDDACNVPTDFSGGLKGVKLKHPSSVYGKAITYNVGPLYYTTPMCDEPEIE